MNASAEVRKCGSALEQVAEAVAALRALTERAHELDATSAGRLRVAMDALRVRLPAAQLRDAAGQPLRVVTPFDPYEHPAEERL